MRDGNRHKVLVEPPFEQGFSLPMRDGNYELAAKMRALGWF